MKTHYRIHRWLAIPLGLYLLLQTVTGALYVIPVPWQVERRPDDAAVAWDDVKVGPQEAAGEDEIRQVLLYRVLDTPVWEVTPVGGASRFVDARDGSRFALDADGARRLAEASIETTSAVRDVRRIERYEYHYMAGHLPAYHVEFEDGTDVWVEGPSGRVAGTSNAPVAVKSTLLRVHDFDVVRYLARSERAMKLALVLVAAVCCVGIASGYNILWQQRRARKRAAAQRERA